ncbi:MAG: hypothetical protein IJL29_00845 [Prevotella sp.]|nr:hypothetical protein [Prevotella sp.]MBQ6031550.1 hypothetical protein [Prevotella sp.]MBQ7717144.1 hypothetical protein [Prevotella sp.]MBQ9570422.1 hypothetical protein [Prevotella sp.]MBR0524283.1 hypothetical protein [Prevotella sp.]
MASEKENLTPGNDYVRRYICKNIFPLTVTEKKRLKSAIRKAIQNADN